MVFGRIYFYCLHDYLKTLSRQSQKTRLSKLDPYITYFNVQRVQKTEYYDEMWCLAVVVTSVTSGVK